MKFATKIFIYFFISTAVILIGIVFLTHYWITDYHLRESIRHEKELATITALKSEEYILRNDPVELYNLFKLIVKSDPYVEYVFSVKDFDILAHTFDKGVPKGLMTMRPITGNDMDITPVENDNGNIIYHLRIAVSNPPNTTIHFGISKEKIQAQLKPHINLMLAVSALLLAIFPFGLATFLSRLVSKPIYDLRKGVKRIGSGELNHRLEIQGDVEIRQLFTDINTMAEELERMHEEMEDEINERIETERNLEVQTELLNNVLNNVPHNIFWKNKSSVYLGCNKSFAAAAGLSITENIIGKTDYDLPWTKEESDLFREYDKQIINSGNPILDIEETITLSNGEQKCVVTSKVPLKDQNGLVFGILGIYYDITERKQMEEIIKQTQKMEAIGTLAGGIAHDFNNILSGIIGYTELAIGDPDDEDTKSYLDKILKFGLRAKDLVRQILTFSRKTNEERKPVNLSSIIKEEASLLRSTIPSTIEIKTEIEANPGIISADETKMHQVVMNLCTNAAQAMEESGGTLTILLKSVLLSENDAKRFSNLTPGSYLELQVSDTGIGIDPGIIHKIFDPFFTTKEMGKGTGMGLSLVHSIVKQYKGEITVTSKPGQGTTFRLLFPELLSGPYYEEESSDHVPTGNERILYIDDEEMLLELGEKIMVSLGYNVKSIKGSIEALETFKKSPDLFDIIITDQTMPNMTGFNLSKHILKINPDARIILCTGYSDSISPDSISSAGIKALLYKPLRKNDLAVTIRNVLDA